MIWSPMVKLGLSEVIGSWKIMASRLPRRSRSVWSGSSRRSKPSKRIAPETSADCFGNRPMMASEVTLLPQPDLPTRPSVAPLRDREVDAVDRMRGAAVVAVEHARAGASMSISGLAVMTSPAAAGRDAGIDRRAIGDRRPDSAGSAGISRKCTQRSRLTCSSRSSSARGSVVVVDAQVELGPFLLVVDQQRRRLLAALVAAGRLARPHGRDQALREGQVLRSRRKSCAVSSSTAAPASMLPAIEKPSPATCPHQSTQSLPVCAAIRPCASMT